LSAATTFLAGERSGNWRVKRSRESSSGASRYKEEEYWVAAVNAGVRAATAETARSVEAALREDRIERHFLVQFDELD
jgi:hypothetical protein